MLKMFKKIHLLVFKSFIGPLILTFFISEFVLIMHFLWLYIGDLVGKGIEWAIIAELLLYASAGLVKMALPLSILLASIMTFGSLGENYELSAMKSAGISLQRVMMPLIILSVFIGIGSFYFSNYVIPYTSPRASSLIYDISIHSPELNIKPGVFNKGIEGYSIKIQEKNKDNGMMYNLMIYEHRQDKGNPKITLADSGVMKILEDLSYMQVTLFGGRTFEELNEEKKSKMVFPEQHSDFDKQTTLIALANNELDRTQPEMFKQNAFAKPISELQWSKDSLSEELSARKQKYLGALNKKVYFKYEHKLSGSNDSSSTDLYIFADNTAGTYLSDITNTDSLYNELGNIDRGKLLKIAIDNAENTKRIIDANQKDFINREKAIIKHEIAWHEKFTLAFACLIFFFIGAPLGAIIRKGGFGLPFLVSIVFFILYYIISIIGRKLVEEGVFLPWQGMWLSSILTLPLGVFLTYKAINDSVLFDIGSFFEIFKRPITLFLNKLGYK